MSGPEEGDRPWHAEGLPFACVGPSCGDCCSGRWGRGYVWVSVEEMERLAAHLGLTFDAFTRRHVRRVGDRYSLTEKLNLDCVFYEQERGCTVYQARPATCRAYPFWPRVLRSRETWEAEARHCPGIGCGAIVSGEQVARCLASHPDSGAVAG